ncbi:MAG: helix-turn-helix domain-containing protein, partial [Sphingobacterium sp.]
FNILPIDIHDTCCDMGELTRTLDLNELPRLEKISLERIIEYMADLIIRFANRKNRSLDTNIVYAVNDIIQKKGQIDIKSVILKTGLNTRTFERRFFNEIGLTAKQYAKIIQFQSSMIQLSSKDYEKLTDIVYQNGFADQSHFIRAFKSFTGKTPKQFKIK